MQNRERSRRNGSLFQKCTRAEMFPVAHRKFPGAIICEICGNLRSAIKKNAQSVVKPDRTTSGNFRLLGSVIF